MSTPPIVRQIDVRVTPRASKNVVEGVRNGRLLVRVTAPPVDAAANEAVIALLAGHFGVARRDVRITSGANARNKRIVITHHVAHPAHRTP